MSSLTELIDARTPVLLDGAMGTMLQDAGLDDGGAGELWNVERVEEMRVIQRAYRDAGARILTTNTFGGSRPRLDMHGLGDRVHELNRAAAEIARSVADESDELVLVAGDIGPLGELFTPLGDLEPEQAREYFAHQIQALVDGGIDLVLIETMSDLAEVSAAVEAAHKVAPDLPVLATMSFDTKGRTMMGVSPEAAVAAIADLGVAGVGANCGRGPEELETVMAAMAQVRPPGLLLVGQSNAGLPHLVGDQFVYDATPERMAEHSLRLRDLGVDVIGGCCGSTPAHIAAMAAALGRA